MRYNAINVLKVYDIQYNDISSDNGVMRNCMSELLVSKNLRNFKMRI